MNDVLLQQSVLDELLWDPSVAAEHIGVTARAGIVTLNGHVANLWEKWAANLAARRVRGVKAIVEEIEVRLTGDGIYADEEISERAIKMIESDGSLPRDRLTLMVEQGWITLLGNVDWNFQRSGAENAVNRLAGLLGVINRITIEPHAELHQVQRKIEAALKRVASTDMQQMTIDVQGGKVTLGGALENPHERNLAMMAAWSAPGVTDVDNKTLLRW